MAALGENDNKRRLSCRAFNKNIPGSTIEDHWDILVMCKSRVSSFLKKIFYPFRQTAAETHPWQDTEPIRNQGEKILLKVFSNLIY